MDLFTVEKRLTLSYVLCIFGGAIASITSGVAWGHWKTTLDQCINRNCSCILYGEYTPSKFLGGPNGFCIWSTFGPLFYIFFAICMTCFHGYRVMFVSQSPKSRTTRSVVAKMEPGESVQIHAVSQEDTNPLPRSYWITISIFSVFFGLFSLVHFSMFLDGFYRTCNQYRNSVEHLLGLHGTALPVIHHRLSCQGIFDFMDYMQPDNEHGYRDGYINTGASLTIGIIGSAISWLAFTCISFLNIKMAKRAQ